MGAMAFKLDIVVGEPEVVEGLGCGPSYYQVRVLASTFYKELIYV